MPLEALESPGEAMKTITIGRRFCGPPNSGNGGYVCGMLARHIAGPAEVALRAPTPLDRPLDAVSKDDGVWQLRDGETVIATGRPASIELEHVERATFEEAVEASKRTAFTPDVHLLPTCFVCGPQRKSGDGLRLFAGPQARRGKGDKLVLAVPWVPDPTLGDKDGLVAPDFVWSALDCPSGYVFAHNPQTGGLNLTPALLGTLTVRIDGRPRLGERCVVTAWETGRQGRRLIADTALFGEAGNILAVGRAIWIAVDRQVQLGKPG